MTTRAWDETVPLDSDHAGEGAGQLRNLRVDISERLLHLCPVGCVLKFASDVPPVGWVECNGAALSSTEYAALYAVIGKTYGWDAGTSKFNVPDYRDKILRGWNHGKASGVYDPDAATRTAVTTAGATMTAGDHVGTEQAHEYRAHTHAYDRPDTFALRTHYYSSGSAVYTTGTYPATPNVSNYPSTAYTETRPDNKRVMFMIRTEGIDAISGHEYINAWNNLVPSDDDPMGNGAQEIRNLKLDFRERVDVMFPIGSMIYWTSGNIPDGWMECNGVALERSSYQDLYDVIGTSWGYSGSTFNIPDLRGFFVKGSNTLSYCGATEVEQLKQHTHTFASFTGRGTAIVTGSDTTYINVHETTTVDSNYYPPLAICDTRPKNVYLPVIIRTHGNS